MVPLLPFKIPFLYIVTIPVAAACKLLFLAGGNHVLSWDPKEKIFRRPTYGRLWCGKVYLGRTRRLSQVPNVSIYLAMGKVQSCLYQAQNKDQGPEGLCQIHA